MDDLLKLINEFEERNNMSISVVIQGDASCCVQEFWEERTLEDMQTVQDLKKFLSNTQYKLDVNGLCIKPEVKIHPPKP